MANRDVEARLRISAVDRTAGVLGRVAERLGLVSTRANQVTGRFNAVAQAANNSGYMLGRGLALAAAALGGAKIIKDAAELERQMNRIGITADATAEETKAATAALREMTDVVRLPFQAGVEALDVLTASGMGLEEAMAFLPSILATAQATGAETVDIANTAVKAASALKIPAEQMAAAFDLMSAEGKAGQFELKDMAQSIPNLANSFATLGYEGTDGLLRLLAILQTLREA
ncbi:MAG: phage tail tape measure protein, partial [Martelella sp.]